MTDNGFYVDEDGREYDYLGSTDDEYTPEQIKFQENAMHVIETYIRDMLFLCRGSLSKADFIHNMESFADCVAGWDEYYPLETRRIPPFSVDPDQLEAE